jgi:chemotaxis protein CheY-P-specific phosphatase CheC
MKAVRSLAPTRWFDGISESELDSMLQNAMQNVEHGLSEMVGLPVTISTPSISKIPIIEVATHAGDPEEASLGVYLLISGGLQGQAILLLPLADGRKLAGMILDRPPGNGPLDDRERATVAEVGNVMVSYFLNAVALALGHPEPLYPSPPLVMMDMLAAILDVVITPVATHSEEMTIVSVDLYAAVEQERSGPAATDEKIHIRFWVVPDKTSQKAICSKVVPSQNGDGNG